MSDLVASRSPYVDGAFVPGDAGSFAVTDPATEEVIAEVEASSVAQVDAAVAAARRAFDDGPWPRLTTEERAAVMYRFADALAARKEVLLETVIAEAGAARGFAEPVQIGFGLASARDMVDLARTLPDWEHNEMPLREYVAGNNVKLSIRCHEPVGVVGAITPSNFPFTTNVWKVVPALMTGCTLVLRPSPYTPLEATVLGEAADEAGLPEGVLNVVLEETAAGAERLSTHPGVDLVSFTGSTAVGRAIAGQAAPGMKRLILELGGKSVQLYLPDALADGPAKAVAGALGVFLAHAGQGCSLQTRMLVPAEHVTTVVDAVSATAAGLQTGDPRDPKTVVGPVVSAASRERIERLVAEGIAAGGLVACGARRPADLDRGYFYEPTLVAVDDNANPLAQHEVFGPVVTVQGYRDLDEAIAITNDSPYDLSAGLYTSDLTTATALTPRIRTGTVQVNTGAANAFTPMGGYKHSGIGRERGVPGIRAFQQVKHVVIGNG
ncbi:MAG TPA: aldehyde dehydrogenase family protein [Acidimicrobiia bacterium]|nr:aldehyde dehydrogenase family protein [Acidimicrobiia bacterium]